MALFRSTGSGVGAESNAIGTGVLSVDVVLLSVSLCAKLRWIQLRMFSVFSFVNSDAPLARIVHVQWMCVLLLRSAQGDLASPHAVSSDWCV